MATSSKASSKTAKDMAKAPITMQTAAKCTKASGRMTTFMAKAPNTGQTAARSTKVNGWMEKELKNVSSFETKQSKI